MNDSPAEDNTTTMSWMDQMLGENDVSNIGRFLWWIENADHENLTDSQRSMLHRTTGLLEELEADLEGSGENNG